MYFLGLAIVNNRRFFIHYNIKHLRLPDHFSRISICQGLNAKAPGNDSRAFPRACSYTPKSYYIVKALKIPYKQKIFLT